MDKTPDPKSNSPRESESEQRSGGRGPFRPTLPSLLLVGLILAAIVLVLNMAGNYAPTSSISYSFFLDQVKDGNVESVVMKHDTATGYFKDPPEVFRVNGQTVEGMPEKGKPTKLNKKFEVPIDSQGDGRSRLEELLDKNGVLFNKENPSQVFPMIMMTLIILLPLAFLAFIYLSIRRSRNDMMGGGFLSGFSKSPAKRYEGQQQPITFEDVAGVEGVKADLMEIVDFLKGPEKFQRLGGRVPKGVLLNGPPGTGKTLLARAVAGEAGVPFYSVSGSEFIQMFVGVGASRVRDLFKTAKDNSPSIIFIDEIDAVGRQRGAGLGGGHDEREQTLNQILSEMDGFSQSQAVIVIAATNRPDVLDPALLRPGRFDRHITVGRPTHKGRLAIFQVHVRDVPLADDVDLDKLAAGTIGLTGADIRNLVNEAALWAARGNKNRVSMEDFDYARDKILMGPKREEVLSEEEKRKTAFHEAGHALIAWLLPGADAVHKVTIVPRGRALGVTQMIPTEDRVSHSEQELHDKLAMALGGRTAEKIVFNELSVGAENDLERATGLARRMVTHWGMSEKLGPVSYKMGDDDPFLGREIHQHREFSEHTMELIDDEVNRIMQEASQRAREILTHHRDKLDAIADALIAEEVIDADMITDLIGESAQAKLRAERAAKNGSPKESKEIQESSGDLPHDSGIITESEAAEAKTLEPEHRSDNGDNGASGESADDSVRADSDSNS